MKIAIVDDNEDDRKRLQEEITKICDNKSRKDFEITEFFSGEDFINLIEKNENKKYFDIVFLDIYMNGITGIETAKKLRETDNQSKIIFITTSNEFASESYEVKAYDYLIKPFSKERILKTIERIFEDEKKNKKMIMVISDLIRAGLVGIIATQLMFATLTRWDLLIITFLISIVESFRQPTSMPVMAQILQSEEMEVGLSLSQSSSKVVEFIGFGVSGVFIATLGNHIVVYIDMMTFLLSALIILTMSIKPIFKDVQEKTYFFTEFKAGIRIIFQYPKIKIFVFLAIFLNAIITPLSSLQAPLVEEVLHSTAIMLSVISTALTLGMIVGSVIYPMVKEKMNIKMIVIPISFSAATTQ